MDMKLRLNKSSHLLVKRDISIDFFVQRFIAEMIAVLKPFSSNVATASIVVPPENKPYPSIHRMYSRFQYHFAEPNTA